MPRAPDLRLSHGPRGYVLIMVLLLIALLSVGVSALMFKVNQTNKTTAELLKRKRVFYETDGMVKAAVRLADNYLRDDPNADLSTAITSADWDSITPSGYSREIGQATASASSAFSSTIPNGPFAGMNARQIPVAVEVQLREPNSGASSYQRSTVVLGQVSAFQFFLFGEGYVDFFPWPVTTAGGRSHVNGDFCLSGNQPFALERVTSSGQIWHFYTNGDGHTSCRATGMNRQKLAIAVGNQCNDFPSGPELAAVGWPPPASGPGYDCTMLVMDNNKDSGCTDPTCSGGWASYAEGRWKGAVADSLSHGVTPLKLPIVGTPLVQAGVHARVSQLTTGTYPDGAQASNRESSRLLVDPLLPSEPDDVREQKFMYKADIRIINGIWFLRDENFPERVGTPIWSDHPGSYQVNPADWGFYSVGAVNVGQDQLANDFSWTNGDWPRFFSYYGAPGNGTTEGKIHDEDDSLINEVGVISYGTLARKSATTPAHYKPGFIMLENGGVNNNRWCRNDGTSGTTPTSQHELRDWTLEADATENYCAGSSIGTVTTDSNLLQGTRSGIRDGHMQGAGFRGDRGTVNEHVWRGRRSKLYPVNFDVAVFQAALGETGRVGELGWHFDNANRTFNGIVYVTTTWPGKNKGFSATADNHPEAWPIQGAQALTGGDDALDGDNSRNIAPLTATPKWVDYVAGNAEDYGGTPWTPEADPGHHGHHQEALPQMLCSAAPGDLAGGVAGQQFDDLGRFVVPDCAQYAYSEPAIASAAAVNAFPNAVRIHNGAQINPTSNQNIAGHVTIPANLLPEGLSIVTDVVVVVQGDFNSGSVEKPATATPWVPTLVGGDTAYHLSNAWMDRRSYWAGGPMHQKGHTQRTPTETEFNHALLAGWAVTDPDASPHGGGVQNFTRYLENWPGATRHHFNGSFLIGFNSVHNWTTTHFGRWAFGAPLRDWEYDPHFDAIDNQPPGAPRYTVNAVRSWRRF